MSFYIDIDKAHVHGLVGRLSFSINGVRVYRVIAAKHGKNGFVEYYPCPYVIKNDHIVSRKLRGNVKISIKPA